LQAACSGYFCSTALAIPLKGGRGQEALVVLGIFTVRAARLFQYLPRNLNSVKHVQQGTLDFVAKPSAASFGFPSHTLSPWGLRICSLEEC